MPGPVPAMTTARITPFANHSAGRDLSSAPIARHKRRMAIRIVLWLLVAATLALGAPYAAAVLSRVQGTWSADAIEQDGSHTHMQFGTDLPRPA